MCQSIPLYCLEIGPSGVFFATAEEQGLAWKEAHLAKSR